MVQLGAPGHATPTMTVLRCGDPDTADRVMAVLRRQAERLSETMVAIDQAKLTASEREKLLGQGIIVQADSDARSMTRTATRAIS